MKNTHTSIFLILTVSAGVANAAVTLGPDAYGYVLDQLNNPAGFTTIVGGAGTVRQTLAGATRDDYTFQVPMGFSFNYYGTTFTDAFVSTNGFIAMGGLVSGNNVSGAYLNPDISQSTILVTGGTGAPTVERAVIAPFWDDLFFGAAQPGALYTQTRTVGPITEFVVEWNGAQFFDAQTTPMTLQAILRSDGTMSFYYPDVTSAAAGSLGASATVGLHDLNGGGAAGRAILYSFNTASLANGDAINITLVPEPGTGLLAMGGLAGMLLRRRRRE